MKGRIKPVNPIAKKDMNITPMVDPERSSMARILSNFVPRRRVPVSAGVDRAS
jgi:hypothetical protein